MAALVAPAVCRAQTEWVSSGIAFTNYSVPHYSGMCCGPQDDSVQWQYQAVSSSSAANSGTNCTLSLLVNTFSYMGALPPGTNTTPNPMVGGATAWSGFTWVGDSNPPQQDLVLNIYLVGDVQVSGDCTSTNATVQISAADGQIAWISIPGESGGLTMDGCITNIPAEGELVYNCNLLTQGSTNGLDYYYVVGPTVNAQSYDSEIAYGVDYENTYTYSPGVTHISAKAGAFASASAFETFVPNGDSGYADAYGGASIYGETLETPGSIEYQIHNHP